MKSKIFATAIFFLAFTTLSSFAPTPTPNVRLNVVANNVITEKSSDVTNPKADKKAKLLQKLLKTKAGKWAFAKMQKNAEKRHEKLSKKLSKKLAIAEKAGDTKKVDKIKKQMNSKKGDLKKLAKILIIGGLIAMLFAVLFGGLGYGYKNGSYGASGVFWALGTLALFIGLLILLLDYLDVI